MHQRDEFNPWQSQPELLWASFSSLHFFSHVEIMTIALHCSCWNTANGFWGRKILSFLPSTSNHHPVHLHMPVAWGCWHLHSSLPWFRISHYKHILTPLRWRADTSFDNTQPTLMQCFSGGASQSCTKESCISFPILLEKWSKSDWNNLHNHTANGRRFGNRIPNAAQCSILWIGQRWQTQYALLVS